MNKYPELKRARDDMKNQNVLYRPTAFWDEASSIITDEICKFGIENFRSLPSALGYFVPTYGYPGNNFSRKELDELHEWFKVKFPDGKKQKMALEQFTSGEMSALADYRVLLASDNPVKLLYLHTFSESKFGKPYEQFEFGGSLFSRSSLNYLLGLSMLKKYLDDDVPKTYL